MAGPQMPLIRLQIEDMKYQVVHYLNQHHTEVEEYVKQAVAEALNNYDYVKEVNKTIVSTLDKAVHQSVESAVWTIFHTEEAQTAVKSAVWGALASVLKKEPQENNPK